MTSLHRFEAITAIYGALAPDTVVVLSNGYVARDGYRASRGRDDFYMIGSMGLAGAIGLGIGLGRPDAPVAVVEGDGNVLMALAVLPMVGAWQPPRFLHVVLDNGTYDSTGAQATVAPAVDLPAVALGCGYQRATSVSRTETIEHTIRSWATQPGPGLLHVTISSHAEPGPRVDRPPPEIAERVQQRLALQPGVAKQRSASRRVSSSTRR